MGIARQVELGTEEAVTATYLYGCRIGQSRLCLYGAHIGQLKLTGDEAILHSPRPAPGHEEHEMEA